MVKKRSKKIKEKKTSRYILPVAIILVLAAGGYAIKSGGGGDSEQVTITSPASTPPITVTSVSLPDYARQTKEISDSYIIATQIPDILEKIPCYCGCGLSAGHKSLKNCFMGDDGTFDRHGSFCNLCRTEAYETYAWYLEGVPVKEIRERIDNKYGKRFGAGTDTPPV